MNWNESITEDQLTPFEKVRDDADYFVSSCMLMSSVQNAVQVFNENKEAINILDWENDPDDRNVLKTVIQQQRELGDQLIEIANKFEMILGISA
jgi:hypothetical protein